MASRRAAAVLALVIASIVPAACGGDKRTPKSDAELARPLIEGWVDAVRRGDPEGAARFFELPTIIEQSGGARELTTPVELLAFNASLPCGARLLDVVDRSGYVVATFRLTERPRFKCDAPGALVRVAFRLHGGRFSEWRQLPAGDPEGQYTSRSRTAGRSRSTTVPRSRAQRLV